MGLSLFIAGLALLQAAPLPPSDALIDKFISVLPDVSVANEVDRTPDAAELERLSRLNSGRAAEVRRILKAKAACTSTAENASAIAMMRRIARSVGAERVERIIAFYDGEDFNRFAELTGRAEEGETLASSQLAELERIDAAYGLRSFYDAMTAQKDEIIDDKVFVQAIRACQSNAVAALAQARLKAE